MVKKITQKRLENIALYYLERYSSSSNNLSKVLHRRVNKDKLKGAEVPCDVSEWISEIVKKMISFGYINDDLYKETLVKKLKLQGKSNKQIKAKLMEKGLSPEFENNIDEEYEQALIFIRKKKIGFYHKDNQSEYLKKDMQKMALAGFSYSVIKKVLDIKEE